MGHSRLQIYLLNWEFLEDQIVLFFTRILDNFSWGMKMSSIIQFNARDRGNVLGIVEDQIWVHFSKFGTFVIFPGTAGTVQARVEAIMEQMRCCRTYKMNG